MVMMPKIIRFVNVDSFLLPGLRGFYWYILWHSSLILLF